MMKLDFAYVIVEGNRDAKALKRLLPTWILQRSRILTADGKSSAISDARTILVLEKHPVALVVDADTEDLRSAGQEREVLRQLLRNAAAGVSCEAFLAVPTLDEVEAKHMSADTVSYLKELKDFVKSATN